MKRIPLFVALGLVLVAGCDSVTSFDDSSSPGRLATSAGSGTDSPVFALAVHEGSLISSSQAGGQTPSKVARWEEGEWQQLGTWSTGGVAVLTVYEGDLIAGGYFTLAGGVSAQNIARWRTH